MFDSFLAELLALGLICICCARLFFMKRARVDAVAIVAPFSLLVAVLSLLLWGAEPQLVLTAALALLVLLTNVRALFRLSAQLYVDHYSILFVSFSLFEFLAALTLITVAVIFRPVPCRPADFQVKKTSHLLTGSLNGGYRIRTQLFEPSKITGILYLYEPETAPDGAGEKPTVLFVAKSTASAVHYEPYFLLLAARGYRIVTADFYATQPYIYGPTLDGRLLRRAYAVRQALSGDGSAGGYEKADAELTAKSYGALTELALSACGEETQFFYAVDALGMDLLNELISAYDEQVIGFFALNRVAEYRTSGFGFIEQTDPLDAAFFGVQRDASFFIPRYVAGKTDEAIQETLKLLHPVEIIRASGKENAQ